jgi:hypothetical protein
MFSSAGIGNFQNLAKGPPLMSLRFGDFDGDGRTDVFSAVPLGDGSSQWMFSPGGVGNSQNLAIGPALEDLRFGDFDGDGRTDVFATAPQEGGSQWMFSAVDVLVGRRRKLPEPGLRQRHRCAGLR